MKKVAELKETSTLSMLSVDMENKENGSLDVKNSVENGRPPDPADWAVADVVNYFRTAGFEEQANAFQEQFQSVYPVLKSGLPSCNCLQKDVGASLVGLLERRHKTLVCVLSRGKQGDGWNSLLLQHFCHLSRSSEGKGDTSPLDESSCLDLTGKDQ
ncbi:sterile alpha motif domain-containing protein 13 isoform 2-T2 [Pangshura tecta]